MNQIESFQFWFPRGFGISHLVFVGDGVFKRIILFFVCYGVSRVENKSVCFLIKENLRCSVNILFGRKSHGA